MGEPDEKVRLQKLLGMLGSSFDGERANAARMIADMARKRKLTITELIYGPAPQRHETKPPPGWREHSQESKVDVILRALAGITKNADDYEFILTNWECQFASDVSKRYLHDYELSEKQLAVAQRIVAKVEAREPP
jgi:hypothetical protein